MEIIYDICYLTIGDKVKHIHSEEGGLILEVVDQLYAKVEFFDEDHVVNADEIVPLTVLSHQKYNRIQFYTEKKMLRPPKKKFSPPTKLSDQIDLHAEVLFPNHYRTMSNENIVQKQLSYLNNYIEKVLHSNMYSITVIHGKGSGSLRSQVIDILENRYKLDNIDVSDLGKTVVVL